jgi:hypothetical protein
MMMAGYVYRQVVSWSAAKLAAAQLLLTPLLMTILTVTSSGWTTAVQINLQILTTDTTSTATVLGNTKTTTGTWNRLVFKDISGVKYITATCSQLFVAAATCSNMLD